MLLTFLLNFLVPFIASDDFDEITHRKYPAMNYSKEQLKRIVEIAKGGDWTYDRAMFVNCKGIDYLRNFTFLAKYDYLNNSRIMNADLVIQQTDGATIQRLYTATLYIEVRGSDYSLSFQFWQFKEPYDTPNERWELSRVENMECGLPKKPHIHEAIEMAQYFYSTKGDWEKDMLPKMFTRDALFKFCDGSYEKYFFNRNDALTNDSINLHHVVRFARAVDRNYKQYVAFFSYWWAIDEEIIYYQVDVTVNGRRMQLEYDDDWKMFTKGREYPCDLDKLEKTDLKM